MPAPALFASGLLLFADAAAAAGGQGAGTGSNSLYVLLFQFGPVILLGYLLLIRPQQQQEKKRRAMVAALKKNDKVITSAGIYGTVASVDAEGDKVVLRVDDDKGLKLVFSKSSVLRVIDVAPEKPAEARAGGAPTSSAADLEVKPRA